MAIGIEWLWVLIPPLGWLGWAIGGTGYKWARRYAYPLLLAILLILGGLTWWRGLLTGLTGSALFHLGYGESRDGRWWTWPYRILLGASYGGSLLWIDMTPIPVVVMSVVFAGLFLLSRAWNRWTWKLTEGLVGLTHGMLAVWLLAAS